MLDVYSGNKVGGATFRSFIIVNYVELRFTNVPTYCLLATFFGRLLHRLEPLPNKN